MDNTLYNYSYLSPKLTENQQQSKIVSKKKREKLCECTNVCLGFGWQVTVFGIVDSYDLAVRINSNKKEKCKIVGYALWNGIR